MAKDLNKIITDEKSISLQVASSSWMPGYAGFMQDFVERERFYCYCEECVLEPFLHFKKDDAILSNSNPGSKE